MQAVTSILRASITPPPAALTGQACFDAFSAAYFEAAGPCIRPTGDSCCKALAALGQGCQAELAAMASAMGYSGDL